MSGKGWLGSEQSSDNTFLFSVMVFEVTSCKNCSII